CSTGSTSRNQQIAPANVSTTPTADTIQCVTSPAKPSVMPSAAIIGAAVGAGSSMVVGSRSSAILQRPITYTVVNTTTHTASTKCQYQESTSTRSTSAARSAPRRLKTSTSPSSSRPTVTC